MNADFGPVYTRLRAVVTTWLSAHGYQLAYETYTPGSPGWRTGDRGRVEFAGSGPPVCLTWDGAYHWLHLRVGEAANANWSVVVAPERSAPNGPDDAELLAAAAAAITTMCESAAPYLRATG